MAAAAAAHTCDAGHPLAPQARPENFCDVCQEQGTTHCCPQGCDFDLCARCYAEPPALPWHRCRSGHRLLSEARPANFCDWCTQEGTAYCCSRGCDFDMCRRCFDDPPPAVLAAARSAGWMPQQSLASSSRPQAEQSELQHEGSHAESGERKGMSNEFCEVCQKAGRLLLCERCPRAFHVRCIERLVDSESLTQVGSAWRCPVCVHGVDVLRGRSKVRLPPEEMEALMLQTARRCQQDLRAARARRDVFLQMNSDLVEPFSSRFAFGRILRQASGRKVLPLDIGSRCRALAEMGSCSYEAVVLAQTSVNKYVVAAESTGVEAEVSRDMLAPIDDGGGGGGASSSSRAPAPPDFLKHAREALLSEGTTLKGYQAIGVNWLIHMFHNRCGGILADDMGLGKTIQTLTFLSYLRASGCVGPFLVVCPLSCAGNWIREAKRFVPQLSVAKFCGVTKERQYLLEDDEVWFGIKDIVITTYETVTTADEFFMRHLWRVVVLDEAHKIKNQGSRVRLALDKVPCCGRVLLTGTPLQNNLGELLALLRFLWPDVLDAGTENLDRTMQLFEQGDSSQLESVGSDGKTMDKLKALLGTLMLRRKKEEVLSLPPKVFRDVWLPFSPAQAKWYRSLVACRQFVQARGLRAMLKLLVRLRQLSGHPRCIAATPADRAELRGYDPIDAQALDALAGEAFSEAVVAQSGKLMFMDKLLGHLHAQNMGLCTEWRKNFEERQRKSSGNVVKQSAGAWLRSAEGVAFLDDMKPYRHAKTKESGSDAGSAPKADAGSAPKTDADDAEAQDDVPRPHKVLVFSQFHHCLDVLEQMCRWRGWRVLRLDSATTRVLRELDIRDFNSDDEDYFVYLIGTRAGGLGINLASANHVVLFDQDWNPHIDFQAVDRAHRIGQQRRVTVYRLVHEWGVEEKLVHRQMQKLHLEQCVVSADDDGDDARAIPSERLSADELIELLRVGQQAMQHFGGEDISGMSLEQLLSRNRRPLPKLQAGSSEDLTAEVPKGEFVDADGESVVDVDGVAAVAAPRARPPPGSTPPPPSLALATTASGRTIRKPRSAYELEFLQTPPEGRARPKKEPLKHFAICFACGNGPKAKRPRKAQPEEATSAEGVAKELPLDCLCDTCPKAYHSACLPSETPLPGEKRGRWTCSWHRCSMCCRGSSECGGMLIHCLNCPTSMCYDCFPPHFRRVHPPERFFTEMNSRGWKVTEQHMAFFSCNSCRALAEQVKRQQMRAEDLEAQDDERKRAALEEKRNLAQKKKQREEEEARRRMKQLLQEHEREELSKKLRSARDQLLRSAEMLLPPLLCSKWLAHCGDKAPKSKAKAKARRDKIVFAVCPNCFFPGHKAAQCPYAPERVSNRSQKGGAAAAAVVEDEGAEDDEVQIVGKAGKEEAVGAGPRSRLCSLCYSPLHGRMQCAQLTVAQREEYLERGAALGRIAEALGKLEPLPEPSATIGMAASTTTLSGEWRRAEAALLVRANEVLRECGLAHCIIEAPAPPPPKKPEPKPKPAPKAVPKAVPKAAPKAAPNDAAGESPIRRRLILGAVGAARPKPKAKFTARSKQDAAAAQRAAAAEAMEPPPKRRKQTPPREERVLVDGEAAGWTVQGRVGLGGFMSFRFKAPGDLEWYNALSLESLGTKPAMRAALLAEKTEIAKRLKAELGRQRSGRAAAEPLAHQEAPRAAFASTASTMASAIRPAGKMSTALQREERLAGGPAVGWTLRCKLLNNNTLTYQYRGPDGARWCQGTEARANMTDRAWNAICDRRLAIGSSLREEMAAETKRRRYEAAHEVFASQEELPAQPAAPAKRRTLSVAGPLAKRQRPLAVPAVRKLGILPRAAAPGAAGAGLATQAPQTLSDDEVLEEDAPEEREDAQQGDPEEV